MCFKGLSAVFDPRRTPWIQMDKASTEKIIEIVKKFPSGALSYFINEEKIVPDASIFNSLNPIILF